MLSPESLPVHHAACKLNPPVNPSISKISPAKYKLPQIFDSIVLRDIVTRHRVRASTVLRDFLTLAMNNTAGGLIVHHVGVGGSEKERVTLAPSPMRREQQARFDAILSGTEFAKPGVAAAHPAMRQSRTP
jgi:hypothetical protein